MSTVCQPSPLLLNFGTPVAPDRLPRVLLRFSGPCGVRDFFDESLTRLAPAEDSVVFMAARNVEFIAQGVDYFGCFAVLNPLDYHLVQTPDPDVFVGENRRVEHLSDVVWIPPAVMKSVSNWAELDASDAHDLVAPTVAESRRTVSERISEYFEELSDLDRSGFLVGNKAFWFKRSQQDRLAILKDHGVAPRWSGTT